MIISWDEYFMGLAHLSALRSKDPNTQVGACIVDEDNKVVSMLISMAQLVIGVAYGVAKSKGIEEPSAKDILSIIGNTTNIFDNIQVFRSIQGFTDEWLEQSATAKDFDDVWFDFQTILSKYNEFVEKERSKTE